jgi:hypothetical protein
MNKFQTQQDCRAQSEDNVIIGNSFVPSYFKPLRNIPYMACNFLATGMSACRRAFLRADRLSHSPRKVERVRPLLP